MDNFKNIIQHFYRQFSLVSTYRFLTIAINQIQYIILVSASA